MKILNEIFIIGGVKFRITKRNKRSEYEGNYNLTEYSPKLFTWIIIQQSDSMRYLRKYAAEYMRIYYGYRKSKIKVIYDNGGTSIDRYTVVTDHWIKGEGEDEVYECLALSDNCDLPNGIATFTECKISNHLGKRTALKNLPENVQKYIKDNI